MSIASVCMENLWKKSFKVLVVPDKYYISNIELYIFFYIQCDSAFQIQVQVYMCNVLNDINTLLT